jgi:hypothetical protein
MVLRHPQRLPLLAMGMVALLTGLWAGLLRLGWDLPLLRPSFPADHGPLMISGFLGTLISLERAVALGRRWAYAAPLLSGLGGLSLIAGFHVAAAQVLILAGSLGLVAIFLVIIHLRPALYTVTMELGALAWLVGNLLWLFGWPISHVVFWWAGFLLLTIAGERQELARLQQVSQISQASFLFVCGSLLAGLILIVSSFEWGVRLIGAGMLGLALWLGSHDIARRTVRQTGVTRFIAVCLLSGYIWLGISGLLAMGFGGVSLGPRYDAILHAFFLGFVFAMIFGHAPIIFPAVLGVRMTFRRLFYLHLILLQATLILRITGDLMAWAAGRQVGGLLNVITLLLFLANTFYSLWSPATRAAPAKAGVA